MALRSSLQGVHHIGITVENMERSFEFYTEVLGGTPIVTGNGFKGPEIHNALLEKEELEGSVIVPNLRDGEHELDVRFIQFDNVVIELLQYHGARSGDGGFSTFEARQSSSSPAVVNAMHISFYLRDNVDPEQFAQDLESRSRERGFDQVRCNMVYKGERNSKVFTVDAPGNDFDGWILLYCKGPSGEQLEFNQVLRKAKEVFSNSLQKRKEDHSA